MQVLSGFLDFVLLPGSEAHSRLSAYLPKVSESLSVLVLWNSYNFALFLLNFCQISNLLLSLWICELMLLVIMNVCLTEKIGYDIVSCETMSIM